MDATTLCYDNIHLHGKMFANLFRTRYGVFVRNAGWDLPNANGMEFDQYDTPATHWICVHEGEEVLGGVRLTPTTHRIGIYSYMIRDAQNGLLPTIPRDLIGFEAPVDPQIWESSRVFVCEHVPAKDRTRVQAMMMHEMVQAAHRVGARTLLGIIPENSPRLARRFGVNCEPVGPVMDTGGMNAVCVSMAM
jgi:N-acyl-L-homoserine lactone synthetase